MYGRRILALGAAGAIAVGLAACGSDDSSDDSSSATTDTAATEISTDDFTTQGNQICADGNKELAQGQNDAFADGQPTPDELDAYVSDTLVPSIQGQIDDLRALGAPADEADDVTAFLDDAQTALDELEADPSSISETTFSDVNEQATAIGLDQCAA